MKKLMLSTLLIFGLVSISSFLHAQCDDQPKAMTVANMEPAKDVVDIAISSPDHTTLVAAVKAAGLVETLKGEGPFTVFAPTNAAFENLPEGTVPTLLKPENKDMLVSVLTYHVIAGNFESGDVLSAIKKSGGKAMLETVQGGMVTAYLEDGNVYLKDENGNSAQITAVDLKGDNGVVHVIDAVILPKG